MAQATHCTACSTELTDANRVAHRRVCADCWRAQKKQSRALNRQAAATVDPARQERIKTAFLDELMRNGGFVERAIKTVGTYRAFLNTAYNNDANFSRLWDTIIELGNEAIETEIYRRAVIGVNKPLAYQGRLTGDSIKEYSDNLLMFYAKARMPGKYRDLPQKGDQMSEEELNAALDKYIARRTKVVEGVEMVM